jgi:hypothetical protein
VIRREDVYQPVDPPAKQLPCIPLWTPGPGCSGQYLICLPYVVELITHWDGTRNVPCTKPACICCEPGARLGSRRRGYIGCYDPRGGKHRIAVVTHNAWIELRPSMLFPAESLVGKLICMERAARSKVAPVRAWLATPRIPYEGPLPPFDLWEAILRIFNAGLRAKQ